MCFSAQEFEKDTQGIVLTLTEQAHRIIDKETSLWRILCV